MRSGGNAVTALCVTVGVLVCELAFAEPAVLDAPAEQFLLFSGTDLWRDGGFGHAGLVWSPDGLDREGFAVKSLVGAGTYRYRTGGNVVTGTQLLATLMPGWRVARSGWDLSFFGGIDIQQHWLRPEDLGNRMRGTHAGARVGADLWYEPGSQSMVNASASFSTVGASYWVRGAFGWRCFDRLYLGPEATALGSDDYRQLRFGVHATAYKTGWLEWSGGLGWTQDSDQRSGIYGRIGLLTRH